MNRYLVYDLRNNLVEPPQRIYARLDEAEEIGRAHFLVTFDGVDAEWFDNNPTVQAGLLGQNDYYDSAPLVSLEFELTLDTAAQFIDAKWADDLVRAESPWVEIELAPRWQGVPALSYTNLFGIPRQVWMRTPFSSPSPDTKSLLDGAFSLDDVPDASEDFIEDSLTVKGTGEGVLVMDVGQGNCNALVDASGRPLMYFDFGAGILRHAGTYPATLTKFCFCRDPAIVLSHWDKDHWAAGGIDPAAQQRTWIVPRQKLGTTHRAFAQCIKANNKLLVWRSTLTSKTVGNVTVEKCTGKLRNHSGLAVRFEGSDRSGARHYALLPGDARYTAIPSHSSHQFTSTVSPHHGADMRSRWVPTCPGGTQSRLVHSYGSPNSFGHPRRATRSLHHSAGWGDPIIHPRISPSLVRETTVRVNGVGHVFLPWDSTTAIPSLPCCGRTSQTATQT